MGKISLQDIRVAVLVSDGFEEPELQEPVDDLRSAGAVVDLLAQTREQMQRGIQGMHGMRMTHLVQPSALIQDVTPDRYQGVLVPGGALSVNRMRESRLHIGFLQNFLSTDKPVAIVGHGGWLLADSGLAQGRTVTSAPAIHKDLERAGAVWKDQEVITDGSLITSRAQPDLPRFTQAVLDQLEQLYRRGSRAA